MLFGRNTFIILCVRCCYSSAHSLQYNEKSFIFAEMPFVMDKRLIDKIVRYFATQPIVKAWVFGSYARGEAHDGSDIDIREPLDIFI